MLALHSQPRLGSRRSPGQVLESVRSLCMLSFKWSREGKQLPSRNQALLLCAAPTPSVSGPSAHADPLTKSPSLVKLGNPVSQTNLQKLLN